MTVFEKGLITTLAVNLLCVLVALPLVLRRIPPNPIYGFRTRVTLSDPTLWFEANAHFGARLIVLCVLSAGATWGISASNAVSPGGFLNVTVAAMLAPVVLAALSTASFLRTLKGEGPRA